MGNTFAGQTLTQTGKIGSDTIDPSKMSFGKLGLTRATITSQSPFVSPFDFIVGSDAKLIHGDAWREITGQVTEDIGLGVTTTIGKLALAPLQDPSGPPSLCGGGWQKLTLQGDQTEVIGGCVNRTVIGSETDSNVGPVTRSFTNTLTEHHQASIQIDQPTDTYSFFGQDLQVVPDAYQRIKHQVQIFDTNIQAALFQMQAAVGNVQGFIGQFQLIPLNLAVNAAAGTFNVITSTLNCVYLANAPVKLYNAIKLGDNQFM